MSENWKHIKTIIDSEPFEINGFNIWDFNWKETGQSIKIKDPNYGKDYVFEIFEISNNKETVRFAAGEFSNCVWGIYVSQ